MPAETPFDEMTSAPDACRPAYTGYQAWLDTVDTEMLRLRQKEAEILFRRSGITFAVYSDERAQERIIPFDVVPRILTSG
ncbi:MAG: circularly permuted type 2 ATP-grasp protein, partial [Pseudomonadota bacterium]